jgi:hypothetical protein
LITWLTGFQYVAQAGLELVIILPQPPECWDYSCAPLYLLWLLLFTGLENIFIFIFFIFWFIHLFICAYIVWAISPPAPLPFLSLLGFLKILDFSSLFNFLSLTALLIRKHPTIGI